MTVEKKLIRLDDAFGILANIDNKPRNEEAMIETLLDTCPKFSHNGENYLFMDDLEAFCNNYIKAVRVQDSTFLGRERGYKGPLVDIETFLESEDYMGMKGSVRPIIKYELERIFANDLNYVEIVLTGGTGFGKSFLSRAGISYLLYKLSMLHDPQAEYDLSPGSSIVIILQAVSLRLARKILFEPLMSEIAHCKYFREKFPFNKNITSELQFPNQVFVIPVSGSEMSALGLNVFAGIISEINYFNVTLNSKILEARGSTDTTYDQAARTYTNLIQRMKNRFSFRGRVPGLLFLDSASHYPGDFLSRKMDEARTNKSIYVIKYAIWETVPADRYCGDKFLVEVGGHSRQSRIIAHKNMANPESEVIEVPVEYRVDFERDIETALRDFAGIAVGYKHAFMPYKESILDAVKSYESVYNNKTLFRYDTCIINELFGAGPPRWEEIVNPDYLEEISFNKDADFALHLDIGISKDCVGLAVGHIQDYKMLPSTSYFNKEVGDFVELTDVQAPVICLDGLLEIQPPNNGEIDLDLLRGLCFYLAKILNLKFATLDRFESAIFIQGFRKLHIRSGQVSVVSTPIPYIELKAAYLEGRILHQAHETYIEEMLRLQYDPKKNKIDHPMDFKKDIADAAASVTHILAHKVAQYKRTKRNAIAETRKLQIGGRR